MDLNELLSAHQLALMRASASGGGAAREGHFAQVAFYAKSIRKLRASYLKPRPPASSALPPTIIYGTYVRASSPNLDTATLECWESEGGALHSPDSKPLLR